MEKRLKKLLSGTAAMLLGILFLISCATVCFAATPIQENGKYEVPITKDLKMGGSNFSDSVIIEKEGNLCYVTFSIMDSASVSDMRMVLGTGKIGEMIRKEGKIEHHTYTLSTESLSDKLTFSMYINAMGMQKEFDIHLQYSEMKKLSDTIDNLGERPAEFVPVILTDAGNTEMEVGSVYTILPASAKIADTDLEVVASAYYLKNGEKQPLEIENSGILLDKAGEYHVVYRAETDLYQTNAGKNSHCEKDVRIIAKIGSTSLAKIANIGDNRVLKESDRVQANLIAETSESYQKIAELTEPVSDRFQIFNVVIYDKDGNEPKLSGNIELYLNADNSFDRSKIAVYMVAEDGSLKPIECSGYGRYVRLETDRVGTFVVCVPGVAFKLPRWAAAVMIEVGIVLAAAAVATIVFVCKRVRVKRAAEEGLYDYDEQKIIEKNKDDSDKQ